MGNEEVDLISVAKPEKKTLLERYNIPIADLSYESISKCSNAKTLERIVLILRSGEEGVYPDLTKHAEDRLAGIKPTSAVLRKAEPVLRRSMLSPDERQELDSDISDWTWEMQSRERDLDEGKSTLISEPSSQPEIRRVKLGVAKDERTKFDGRKRVKPKRISSCDYAAWDKYDVDTEINRIDLRDEQRQAEMKRIQERRKELDKTNKLAHKATVDKLTLTGTELDIIAAQEREKGNEAFRAADYEEALRHYNISIETDSNPMAYNNRAMTLIKLRHYEDALNDCNMVLSTDYRNVKALLRRALSLEHLEQARQALADYEAVLKLEPTNQTAISGVNKLRKSCESRKVRMKIEEGNISDSEDKVRTIKARSVVGRSSAECPKLRVNSDICYCDRAPGSSRNVAKPHVKASYCMETDGRKTTAAAATANKSSERATRAFASDNKLSKSQDTAIKSDDIFTICRDPFPRPRDAERGLEKSIFSCVSSPFKGKSSVIIEELPNDETCEISSGFTDPSKTKMERKKETNPRRKKDTSVKKWCVTSGKGFISPEEESEDKASPPFNKIQSDNECRKENEKLEVYAENLENVESPYEFLRLWQSLKNDTSLKLHAKLLRFIAHKDMNKFIGNKLDATMFSLILRCLEQQFCSPEDASLLADLLYSLSRLSRFSIVCMFMNVEDKKVLENILRFLEEKDSPKVLQLRQIYVT